MGYMGPGAQFSTPVPSTYDGMSSFTGQQRMITAKTDLYPPGMPPSQVSYQTQALIQRNNQPGFYDALSPYSSQHALPMGMQQQRGNWYGHVTEPLMDFSSMQSKMLPEISDSDFKFDLTDINLDFRSPSSEAKSPAVKSEKSGISSSRLSEGPKPFTNTRQGSTSVKPKKRRVRRVDNNERPGLEQAVKTYTGTLQGRELCKHFKSTLGLATTPKPYDLANIRAKFKKGPQIGLKTEPNNSASPNTGLEQSHINMPGSPLDDWGDFFKSGDNQHTSSLESKTALGQSYGGFNFTGDASNAFEFDAAALPPTSQSHEFGLISQQPQMPRQFYPTPLPAPAAIHPPASLLAPGWGLSGNNSLSQSQRMPTNSSNTGFPVWDTVGGFPNSYSVNDVTSQQRMQGGGQYPQDKTFSPFHGLPQVPSNANSAFSNLGGEGYSAHDFEAFIKSLERHSPRP